MNKGNITFGSNIQSQTKTFLYGFSSLVFPLTLSQQLGYTVSTAAFLKTVMQATLAI